METLLQRFTEYTEPYLEYGDKIRLKIDHSLRVRDLCVDIGDTLEGFEKELSAACGLMHDIGRFEQWRIYGTYRDEDSIDHGDLGAEILSQNDLLKSFSQEKQDIIIDAVRYHNKFAVPAIGEMNRRYAFLTRDADKIDILDLYASGGLTQRSYDSAMTDAVYQKLLDRSVIEKTDLKTKADILALRLAFLFDMHYNRSFQILQENDTIGRMIDLHRNETGNATLKKQLSALKEWLDSYISDKAR